MISKYFSLALTMSVAELVIPIRKPLGAACGFTLLRNSCTVNKVVENTGDLRPGDVILAIDDAEVCPETVRDALRGLRDKTEAVVVVARSMEYDKRVFGDQTYALGILSPKKSPSCCFFFNRKKPDPPVMSRHTASVVKRNSLGALDTNSPIMHNSSLSSLGSAGVRPVDLRKLKKEGAASMWKAPRSTDNSICI
jgi:hypothetical protein